MAITQNTYNTLLDDGFKAICKYEFITASIAIVYEANTTENHEKRLNLAKKILKGELSSIIMANAVMSNATIQTKVEAVDNSFYDDIAFVVSSVFNAIAEAYA